MKQRTTRITTRVIAVTRRRPEAGRVRKAAAVLTAGGLVAFPTETVYGLGANALSARAVRGIFRAKGRPADNPLIVHVADVETARSLVHRWPPMADRLVRRFWPGPLTLILPKSTRVPSVVTAGRSTVALRMPRHAVALALIRLAGTPIAAPSANLSGRPSPTSAAHVLEDLDGRVDVVIDGGRTAMGLESTVLDLTRKTPTILRPGHISARALRAVTGRIRTVRATDKSPRKPASPGMKYRHYAPRTPLILVEGSARTVAAAIRRRIAAAARKGWKVGVITGNRKRTYAGSISRCAGSSPAEVARALYRLLRELDGRNLDIIIVEGVRATGLGVAIMNRLRKAAGV